MNEETRRRQWRLRAVAARLPDGTKRLLRSWLLNRRPLAASLGFPVAEPANFWRRAVPELSVDAVRARQLPDIRFEGRDGTALVAVCTLNHLHMARALIQSIRGQHSEAEMAIYVLVVDWDGDEPLALSGAQPLAGRAIGIDLFEYMALKYTAIELCCACKPFLLRYVMSAWNHRQIVYLDCDMYVFGRLDHLLACLDGANLVVVPHTLAPFPNPHEFNARPSFGDLIAAGTYNAGMFGLTVGPETARLVDLWGQLVSGPGAFLPELGAQHEQQYFNWLVGVSNGVRVLKDTAYNVAYWNLHDRSLRYAGWDRPGEEVAWRVDGKPLVSFHFSGFSLDDPRRLSHNDSRYVLYSLPSLTRLLEFYVEKLFTHGATEARAAEYRYDRFPSGLRITPDMRRLFKRYELFLWREVDPWSEAGEQCYGQALFLPMPATSSLLPLALFDIYERRPDLQQAYPEAHVEPGSMLRWYSEWGPDTDPALYEYFDRYRPTIPILHGIESLANARKAHPGLFAGLSRPLSSDRTALLNRLVDAGLDWLAGPIRTLQLEYIALSPIYLLWDLVERRPDLRSTFPDLLFAGAPGFQKWLVDHGPSELLEPALADVFARKCQGRSLARIFSFLNRNWDLASQWPLALVGQDAKAFARTLLAHLPSGLEFDLDDVVMYLWTMAAKPWAGLPLTFELLVNACRQPSPLLAEGQEALLGPLLHKPEFQRALETHRRATPPRATELLHARRYAHRGAVLSGWPPPPVSGEDRRGVNLFGYFKSQIGLGSLSRGLALALRSAGVSVQENVVGNLAMEPDLEPEDFIRRFDHTSDTNLFLSYPHLQERLLSRYPEHVVRERRNVVYLAWEQRDGYPTWPADYADFDQIWALSNFAAECFRRYMNRDDVIAVPGVIDFPALPAPASKREMGLDPDRCTFLYVFDANSSIERKNPDGVIAAFARAFSADDKVQLLLKVSNGHRLDHRSKLRQLAAAAARSRLDVRFLLEDLPYPDLLRLLSAVDCYVSLHRAEGFGYTCAEAMAYARPVIATDYSATTEFMSAESAFPVEYEEREVTVADGPFQRGSIWAEPSIEHAAAQMRCVYSNPAAARQVGERGQANVRRLLSAERAGAVAAAALYGGAHRSDGPVLLHPDDGRNDLLGLGAPRQPDLDRQAGRIAVKGDGHHISVGPNASLRIFVGAEAKDQISQQIRDGHFETPPSFALMLAMLRPGETVLDLGAHVGTFALAAAARGCRVIAVEALPDNVALLRASVRENGFRDLTVVATAVGDRRQQVRLVPDGPYSLVTTSPTHTSTIEVPMVTVDELLRELGVDAVGLVKIDVEGSEVMVIRGMSALLARADAPPICYEANGHTLHLLGETPSSLRTLLTRYDYQHYRIDPGLLIPVGPSELQVDCNIDCLASRPPFIPPAGWSLQPARTSAEQLAEILSAARHPNEHHRTYTARVLAGAPGVFLSDPRVREALAALRNDLSPAVRAAAAWWPPP